MAKKMTQQLIVTDNPLSSSNSDAQQQDIAVAAYYRAQARGFAPGNEMQDWLEAEQAIHAGSTGKR